LDLGPVSPRYPSAPGARIHLDLDLDRDRLVSRRGEAQQVPAWHRGELVPLDLVGGAEQPAVEVDLGVAGRDVELDAAAAAQALRHRLARRTGRGRRL